MNTLIMHRWKWIASRPACLAGAGASSVPSFAVAAVFGLALFAWASAPVARANLIVNGDFEADPFAAGWSTVTASAPAVVTTGLGGSGQAARFGDAAPAPNGLVQTVAQTGPDWTFEADFIASDPGNGKRSIQLYLNHFAGRRINLYLGAEGVVWVYDRVSGWVSLFGGAQAAIFSTIDEQGQFTTRLEHHLKIVGRDYGTADASYDVILTDSNGTVHSQVGLKAWQLADPTTPAYAGLQEVTLVTSAADSGRWVWDNVQVTVPEPATASLLMLGALLMLNRSPLRRA